MFTLSEEDILKLDHINKFAPTGGFVVANTERLSDAATIDDLEIGVVIGYGKKSSKA